MQITITKLGGQRQRMRFILRRLYKIAKADGASRLKKIGDLLFGDLEKNAGFNKNKDGWATRTKEGGPFEKTKSHVPPLQVVEDLAVFNLKPPCSWEDVKKARNREIKKYHSDHFIDDPDKYNTSKEIMQIYNAAYDRLKAYYKIRGVK